MEKIIINKRKHTQYKKIVVFVKPGQNKLLKKQNSHKSYSIQKPGNDFNLLRRLKRKINGSPLTHTYIFDGFYRAAKYLNFEAYWIDNQKDLENVTDDKTIVFCEGSYMPDLDKKLSCKYVVHSIPRNLEEKCRELTMKKLCLNLEVFKKEALCFDKFNDLAFFNDKFFTLYQPWATNLLPHEIEDIEYLDKIQYSSSYYIGLLYGSGSHRANDLNKFLKKSNKKSEIKCVVGASDSLARELTLKSSICIDIRSGHHLEVGYIPCRVFNTLSYGREIFVNSKLIKKYLNHIPYVNYYSSGEDLRNKYENFCSMNSYKKFYERKIYTLNFIKKNHTFVNRLNNIVEILN